MNVPAVIERLRVKAAEASELHRLRDRVEELEELLGLTAKSKFDPFLFLKLAPGERPVVHALYRWDLVNRTKLFTLMFGHRLECDQPEEKIIDVYLSKVRTKLLPFGISINTQYGDGWFFTQAAKNRLTDLSQRWQRGEKLL